MYALDLNVDNRILSACVVLPNGDYTGMPIVDTLPEGNLSDYLYVDGVYILDPWSVEEPVAQPTDLDYIKAQVAYTALITNTALPTEEE